MSRDKLLELAKEAGFQEGWVNLWAHVFERFAALLSQQEQEPSKTAEEYLREKYGAYRAHHEWRALEDAFNAGRIAPPPAQGWNEAREAIKTAIRERAVSDEIFVETAIEVIDALARPSQAQERQQFAPCYVCGRPMDGLSEDDCHCFHRRELAQVTDDKAEQLMHETEIALRDTLGLPRNGTQRIGQLINMIRVALSRAQHVAPANLPTLPDRVIDALWQAAGLTSFHPDGSQQDKFYDFADRVREELQARLPSTQPQGGGK